MGITISVGPGQAEASRFSYWKAGRAGSSGVGRKVGAGFLQNALYCSRRVERSYTGSWCFLSACEELVLLSGL